MKIRFEHRLAYGLFSGFFKLKAVFLADVGVLFVIHLGEEHVERAYEKPAVAVEGAVDHHLLAGFRMGGCADDHIEILIRRGIDRLALEVADDIADTKVTFVHGRLTFRPGSW